MQSYLQNDSLFSPLSQESVIRPKKGKDNKTLVAALILTSLVDAFSILVIYLLMNTTAATETLDLEKEINSNLSPNTEGTVFEYPLLVDIQKLFLLYLNIH